MDQNGPYCPGNWKCLFSETSKEAVSVVHTNEVWKIKLLFKLKVTYFSTIVEFSCQVLFITSLDGNSNITTIKTHWSI